MAESGNSYQKIYEIVKQIPKGCVASYGQVAALAGIPDGQEWLATRFT